MALPSVQENRYPRLSMARHTIHSEAGARPAAGGRSAPAGEGLWQARVEHRITHLVEDGRTKLARTVLQHGGG
jgi:hypothetical protein